MTVCNGTLTATNQTTIYNFLEACYGPAVPEKDKQVLEDIKIHNYTGTNLDLAYPPKFSVDPSPQFPVLSIAGSGRLQKIEFQQAFSQFDSATMEDLTNLTVALSNMTLAGTGATGPYIVVNEDLTLLALPNLLSFPTVIVGGNIVVKEVALSGGVDAGNMTVGLISGQQNITTVSCGLSTWRLTCSFDDCPSVGALSFQNPNTTTPFNIITDNIVNTTELDVDNIEFLSVPGLQNIYGNMTLRNGPIQSLIIPDLTTVQKHLTLDGFNNLTAAYFTALSVVGGDLSITNSGLEDIRESSFPALKRIGGNLHLSGRYSGLTLPLLSHVGGSIILQSTAALNCSSLDFVARGVVAKEDDFSCNSSLLDTAPSPSSSASTAPVSPTPTPLPSLAAKIGGAIGGSLGGLLVIVCVTLFLWWRFRSKKRETNRRSASPGLMELEHMGPISTMHEALNGEIYEAPVIENPRELHGSERLLPVELGLHGSEQPAELGSHDSGSVRTSSPR